MNTFAHAMAAPVPVPTGQPEPALSGGPVLLLVGLCCLLLAVLLVVLIVVLSKPARKAPAPRAQHVPTASKDAWRQQIDQVVARHQRGEVNQSQAMSQLAEIVRAFASQALGRDMTTQTLAELSNQPRTASNRQQMDLLRQTVSALYPPEFADPQVNRQAYEAQVEEAAQWVSALVSRWRS
ncbi:hypothetical protein KIM372_06540 [Bombiscardovia nodaiensis]|uniref:DUF4129 domain-containing protein n=1 Tax=Bombiscardovia nodaiensis TaxID=2932181 RepID=A0ABN6SBW7_9BIFI|nr:hypothetical protein KIM372_06540 [Bombiscardovia nodaiensis]